jgi:adenylate kinase family enzyme
VGDLVVVNGPPGAGKSTVAKALVARFDPSVLVEGDAFFDFLANGRIDPWLPEAHPQNQIVIAAAAAAAGRFAADAHTVVYDGIIGPWLLDRYVAAVGPVPLHHAVLMPSEQTCVDRVQSRRGHGFTDVAATRHMYRQFAGAGFDAGCVLADPPDEPEAVAGLIVARLESGALLQPRR